MVCLGIYLSILDHFVVVEYNTRIFGRSVQGAYYKISADHPGDHLRCRIATGAILLRSTLADQGPSVLFVGRKIGL